MTGIVFGVAKEFQGKGMEGALIVYAEKNIVEPGSSTATPSSPGSATSTRA
jgi:hypothetical protein